MYKGSCKHMQWKSKEKSYADHDKLPDKSPQLRADFIRSLKKGIELIGVVNEVRNGKVILGFCHDQIHGEIVGESNHTGISPDDLVKVELEEKTLGNDGCVYLRVQYLSRIHKHHSKLFKCRNCDYETTDIAEFRQHINFKCKTDICKYCGARYSTKDEFEHFGGKCCKNIK